jgi:hypothetical protein
VSPRRIESAYARPRPLPPRPRLRRRPGSGGSAAGCGDRGSLSIELAILLPAFLGLAVLATVLGRQAVAQTSVDLAAHDAARAASITRDDADATTAATTAAGDTLRDSSAGCTSYRVDLAEPSGFAVPPGQPAVVTVTVTCTVSLTGLLPPGVPDTRVLTSTFTSPLDLYRGRS